MRIALIALFLSVGVSFSETPIPKEASASQSYIVGISPYLPRSVKDDIYRSIIRLVVEDLPLNSSLEIYDAFDLKTIARVELPNARVFQSPKTRANQFAPAIRELKSFLAREQPKSTNSHSPCEGAIRLPQFLDFLTQRPWTSNSEPDLLLIGSPLYEDAKEPRFSMVDGYFPSDGHLQASRETSIFGFTGDAGTTPRLTVNWVYTGDPWISELHKEKVTRFWTLYLERCGFRMASFAVDLPTVFQSFRGRTPGQTLTHWAVDPHQTKIEMLRVSRNVEIADWLTRDKLPENSQSPPGTMIGAMKIGIRWKDKIDIDLYATPRSGAETLFFQHPRSPEGYYYKDHRASPGKEYEFIEFESAVDVREVEAFINFYKGDCPGGPRGEVRIEFDGRIYGAPFVIRAEEGNLGRTGRSQQEFWTRIPIQEMLRIAQSGNRAG
jgi:hypothetical protein